MYADPTHIRNERVNLSLSKKERRALEAISDLNGCQPSTFMRGLLLQYLSSQGGAANSVESPAGLRAAH